MIVFKREKYANKWRQWKKSERKKYFEITFLLTCVKHSLLLKKIETTKPSQFVFIFCTTSVRLFSPPLKKKRTVILDFKKISSFLSNSEFIWELIIKQIFHVYKLMFQVANVFSCLNISYI